MVFVIKIVKELNNFPELSYPEKFSEKSEENQYTRLFFVVHGDICCIGWWEYVAILCLHLRGGLREGQ